MLSDIDRWAPEWAAAANEKVGALVVPVSRARTAFIRAAIYAYAKSEGLK